MKKIYPFIALLTYTIVFVILLNSNIVFALDNFPKGPHPKLMEQLTEEQQEEVKVRVQELWESGASREEIRDTVHKMLEKYGVEFEAKRRYGKSGSKYELKATLSKEKAAEMLNELSNNFILLDMISEGYSVKVKKKETPKIGTLKPQKPTKLYWTV